VCMTEFESSVGVLKLPCKHVFHKDCIGRWLSERSRSCPLCGDEVARELPDATPTN
jgi:hypothetical protein